MNGVGNAQLLKVAPGQTLKTIRRGDYNAMIDAARANQQVRSSAPTLGASSDATIIRVRNDTGDGILRGRAIGFGRAMFLPESDSVGGPFTGQPAGVRGVLPRRNRDAGRFAITLQPIPAGAVGKAIVKGVARVRLYVAHEDHRCADIDDRRTLLRSFDDGPVTILWKEEGLGEKWALVEIGDYRNPTISAIITTSEPIPGSRWRWRYGWAESIVDGNPSSPTFGRWIAKPGGRNSLNEAGEQDSARMALNRMESHHDVQANAPEGTVGYAKMAGCNVEPLPIDECPPSEVTAPIPQPVPNAIGVKLFAERDTRDNSILAFDAMVPWRFEVRTVNGGSSG